MAERIATNFQRVFEVRLLHHYWLDEGNTVFDQIADSAKKVARLLTYDMRPFLAVTPTDPTATELKGLGFIYRATTLGFMVAAPKGSIIPAGMILEFVVTVQDAAFFNYTALTIHPQKIYELFSPDENKIYRYKENVPVLSNRTGTSRVSVDGTALFLSREYLAPSAADQAEFLVQSGGIVLQLDGDQPNAGTHQVQGSVASLPVFVHQGDLPAITPPAGLVGAPQRGIELSADIPDEVFALVRVEADRNAIDPFSIVDANGAIVTPNPVFELRFKSRSTIWKYYDKSTHALASVEADPHPLTYFGNGGTKQKPSEGFVVIERDPNDNRITNLVSEIFA